LCWYISAKQGFQVPARILELHDAVQKRYNVRIRQLDMRHYDEEVKIIIELATPPSSTTGAIRRHRGGSAGHGA